MRRKKEKRYPRKYFYSSKGHLCMALDGKVISVKTGNPIGKIPKDVVFYSSKEVEIEKILSSTYGKWLKDMVELSDGRRR